MLKRESASAEKRYIALTVAEPDVPKRFLRVMGRVGQDHSTVMAEFNTSSGADTPSLRQLDNLSRLTGFDTGFSDNPMMPGAPVPGDPSASSPRPKSPGN